MGEKIKTLSVFKLNNKKFEIELNKPSAKKMQRSIHIQNENFKIDFSEKDFLSFATAILAAQKKLIILKRINEVF